MLARVALPFIAGYFVSYVYRMMNAVLGPTLAEEFGLTAGGLGLLSSVYFLSFALFQLPLGLLLDRFGPRRVNATLLLLAALGGLWFAFAHSAASAIAARALIGLGVSGCLMASFTAFVLWYPADRLSTMNGITFAAGALGAITATVPLELLLRVMHWREVFLLLVAATVLVSLVLWLWVPERRRQQEKAFSKEIEELWDIMRDPAFQRLLLRPSSSGCRVSGSIEGAILPSGLRRLDGTQPSGCQRICSFYSLRRTLRRCWGCCRT